MNESKPETCLTFRDLQVAGVRRFVGAPLYRLPVVPGSCMTAARQHVLLLNHQRSSGCR
jgi:hypothetical protein